jgi:hypothetical protein
MPVLSQLLILGVTYLVVDGAILGVCSGWGLNPTLRVLPVPFDYLANGVFADG